MADELTPDALIEAFRQQMEGHTHVEAESHGDATSLVVQVVGPFKLKHIADIPIGSDVLIFHIDSETGRAVGIEGMHWTDGLRTEAIEAHEGDEEGQTYSGALAWVPPLTDEEAVSIADSVMSETGMAASDHPGRDVVRKLLIEAAKRGRGLEGER